MRGRAFSSSGGSSLSHRRRRRCALASFSCSVSLPPFPVHAAPYLSTPSSDNVTKPARARAHSTAVNPFLLAPGPFFLCVFVWRRAVDTIDQPTNHRPTDRPTDASANLFVFCYFTTAVAHNAMDPRLFLSPLPRLCRALIAHFSRMIYFRPPAYAASSASRFGDYTYLHRIYPTLVVFYRRGTIRGTLVRCLTHDRFSILFFSWRDDDDDGRRRMSTRTTMRVW